MVSEHDAQPAARSGVRSDAQVLVASNRGPVSYTLGEDGSLDARRGGGGLVSGLSAVDDKLWVCAALGAGDREAVRRGVGEPGVRMLDIDAAVHADAYNGIANSVLWFVHHMIYQTPVEPVFDAEFRRQWASYEAYNQAFAQALAEEAGEGAAVLVQDYHLSLVPGILRELRPDLRIGHFSHTPWAPVDYFRLLPDDIGEQLLKGILGADRAAFLTRRWADAFIGCCTEILGGTGRTRIGVHAYRALLEERPEWRERVVHIAFAYPSRQDLAVYRDYTAEVQRVADGINAEYGTAGWTPVLLHVDDDFARSLAAYRLADVALVNPIRDGMNLVAKEVPVVSDQGCALVLSREAGAYEELGEDALVVNPYDVSATAAALHEALTMEPGERSARSKRLADAATALPPQQWFLDQLDALRS